LKFGGDFAYGQYNTRGGGNFNGSYSFVGSETGNDFADFLLGAPDTFVMSPLQAVDLRIHGATFYGQDSYRVLRNLTLNYGLRWELGQPWYDTQGRLQTFVAGEQSQRFVNSPTGYIFSGDPGVTGGDAATRLDDWAPRLGIAYSPAVTHGLLGKIFGGPGKTSIRAAAGIFDTRLDTEGPTYEMGDAPFGNYFRAPTLVYLEEPFKSRLSGANPGQRFPVPPPSRGVSFASFQPLSGDIGYEVNNVTPYAEDFNLTIQRQIGRSTVLSVGYVGTRGHHLFSQVDNNDGSAALCLHIASLYAAAGEPGLGCGPFGEDNIYSIGGQTFNGTRPYSVTSGRYLSQGLLDIADNTYEATMGNSNYNSLQVSVNKTAGPLTFLAAYTWSKSLDNASQFGDLINPFNPKLSKSLSRFDMTNIFAFSYVYQLPLQRLTHGHSGVGYRILSGWHLAGITHFTAGLPVSLSEPDDLALTGSDDLGNPAVDLPNYSGQPIQFYNPRRTASNQYFSTGVFSSQQLGVPGNANRRFFAGPGLNDWDMSLFKNVRFTERISMDIRGEFFNIFNHAQFNNPVGDFTTSNFGDVTSARDPRIGQVAVKIYF
jgi:hypothetical protein